MSFTGHEVLVAARDGSPFFDRTRIPGGPADRFMKEIERDLALKIMHRDPETLAAPIYPSMTAIRSALSASGSGANVGVPLVAGAVPELVVRAWVSYDSDFMSTPPVQALEPLEMLTPEMVRCQPGLGWWAENGIAYFTGTLTDWSTVKGVRVDLVALGASAFGDSTLWQTGVGVSLLPDSARNAVIRALQLKFAQRLNGAPVSLAQPDMSQVIALDVGAYQKGADDAERMFLSTITNQRRKLSRHVLRGDR